MIDLLSSGLGACCFLFFINRVIKMRFHEKVCKLIVGTTYFLLGIFAGTDYMGLPLMVGTFCILLLIGKGTWKGKLYLVTVSFAIRELIRFIIYYAFTGVAGWMVDRQVEIFLENQCNFVQFDANVRAIEKGYTIIFFVAFFGLQILALYRYKKYLPPKEVLADMNNLTFLYLSVPALAGLVYCMIIRNIQFEWVGEEIWMLDKRFPIVRLLVPIGSLLCLGAVFFAALLLKQMNTVLEKQQEHQIYKNRVQDMTAYIKDIERMYGDVRSMRHDLKNYVADMQLLAEGEEKIDKDAFKEYLEAVSGRVDALTFKYVTGNPITDVVVNRHLTMAEKKGIRVENTFLFPQNTGIEAFDLSIILNNALENAIEACPADGYIAVTASRRGCVFLLSVCNTFKCMPVWENGIPISSKSEDGIHGWGIRNMLKIAERYMGTVKTEMEGDTFKLEVLLRTNEK